MDNFEKLERLHDLKERGILTEKEFIQEKKKLLSDTAPENSISEPKKSSTLDAPATKIAGARVGASGFSNIDSLTKWFTFFAYFSMVFIAIAAISSYMYLEFIDEIKAGKFVEQESLIAEAEENDALHAFWGNVYFLPYLISFALLLRWVYVSNRSLQSIGGQRLKYKPGWAVFCFLCPIISLFLPPYIMSEIWRASKRQNNWRPQPTSRLVSIWGFSWVFLVIAGLIVKAAYNDRLYSKLENIEIATKIDFFWYVSMAVFLYATLIFIKDVSRNISSIGIEES